MSSFAQYSAWHKAYAKGAVKKSAEDFGDKKPKTEGKANDVAGRQPAD